MSYRIITDTCCDFPQSMYKELELTVVPMSVNYQGQTLTQFTEETIAEIYQGLRNGEAATTSAVNPEEWKNYMEPHLQAGEDVLVLAFSSGLSTTYQSAMIAADELRETYPQRKICVVDTLCASMGQGLLVYYACKHRDQGMALEELAAWCENNKQDLCHWFTVDDLMYLKRGGRVSAATALVGTMLQIKPLLHVDEEGHLVSVAKARGRKASLDALAKKTMELGEGKDNRLMFISHGDCYADAQYLADVLKSKYGVEEVVISMIGAVIGSHAGPGTVALFFLGNRR